MSLTDRGKQIRRDVIKLSRMNGGYHLGGSFSCVEILSTLYDKVLKLEDTFLLSKGHSCWPLYLLLQEKGNDPLLESHPQRDIYNGIFWTSGSLGHGLPAAIGMALARKIQSRLGKVFVLMGDGECQEGTTWESLLIAGKYVLDNLVVIVDHNQLQGSGIIDEILPVSKALMSAADSAGWLPTYCPGHDEDRLKKALSVDVKKPHIILAKTVKGKGVSFMEDKAEWHARWLNEEELSIAMEELR